MKERKKRKKSQDSFQLSLLYKTMPSSRSKQWCNDNLETMSTSKQTTCTMTKQISKHPVKTIFNNHFFKAAACPKNSSEDEQSILTL